LPLPFILCHYLCSLLFALCLLPLALGLGLGLAYALGLGIETARVLKRTY
jgi:hypothetical protein